MFKRLTGDDPVEGRHLYEDAFQFEPVAKHLYAANQVPGVSSIVGDDDVAFWRRWLIVKFPTYIREPDRDPDLGDVLERELPGVLNWAIEGWARCRDQGGFTGAETYEETRNMWKKWGESADEFLLEVCESDSDATNLHTSEVYDVYQSWCRQNGRDAVDQRELTMTLKRDDADLGYKQSVRTGRNSVREGFKRLGFDEVVHDALADVLAENDDSVEDVDSGQTGLDDVGE